ncbi:acyltransferase family protein [Rossellomorea vietnamensis]|uniref:acyltransferase family protein n=1 Tax=Rossellomorea vietnamensis TaxID=218284 RepID=UPI003CF3E923
MSRKDIEGPLTETELPGKSEKSKKKRINSVDMARGLVVLLSVFVSALPWGGLEYFRHAEWYGLTITDIIFPAFLTLYGIGMAIAYFKRVKWRKLIRRTIAFIFLGLIFNMIGAWEIDFSTLRFTGVLQIFSITGIGLVLITRLARQWWAAALVGFLIVSLHTAFLLNVSDGCAEGLPQPDCNPGIVVDRAVFGEEHLYHQGERGYDPEGLMSLPGALSNVLFGYAAGMLMLQYREKKPWLKLVGFAVILAGLSLLLYEFLPFNKRIWTGSFTLFASSVLVALVALFYVIYDGESRNGTHRDITGVSWIIEAYGRNSLLIYFGKYILISILYNVTLSTPAGKEQSMHGLFLQWIEEWSGYPQVTFALFIVLFWTIVAIFLHRKNWYLRI